MATGQTGGIAGLFRRTVLRDGAGLTDGELLECFLDGRDEAAFEAIVRRHGSMVLGVCRRLLGHEHDAEDAFQATFLVLARRAESVSPRDRVGSWLYGVACRTALELRRSNARRRGRETQVSELPHPTVEPPGAALELRPLLDEELSRLPDKYRVPMVLCELEGRSRKEVAGQLRLPEGTLSSRLATARKLLALRLARRGLALSAAALAAALSEEAARAGVPAPLVTSAVKGAVSAAVVVPARVAALAKGVEKAMLLSRLKAGALVLLAATLAVLGAGAFAYHAAGDEKGGPGRPTKDRPGGRVAGVPAAAGRPAPKDPKTDRDLLQGMWNVVWIELQGKFEENDDYKLHFQGDRCDLWKKGRVDEEMTYTLDPSAKPKRIDLKEVRGTPKVKPGIYELNGDRLKVCFVERGDRPAEFRTQRGTQQVLLVLEREKKAGRPRGGRILVWRQMRLGTVQPDGKDFRWHSEEGGSITPMGAQLSPDGKQILYGARDPDAQPVMGDVPHKVHIRGLDDKEGTPLGVEAMMWRWHPDGVHVAVATFEKDGITNALIDVKTKKKTELKLGGRDIVTDFSPDGRWLVTTRFDKFPMPTGIRLYLVRRDGDEEMALTKPDQVAVHGRLSPDGRRVLYLSRQKKGDDVEESLWVAELRGGKPVRVSQERNAELMGHCWSPDGKQIAYVWRQKGAAAETESFLMVVGADGKGPVTVLSEKGTSGGQITLSWPDWR